MQYGDFTVYIGPISLAPRASWAQTVKLPQGQVCLLDGPAIDGREKISPAEERLILAIGQVDCANTNLPDLQLARSLSGQFALARICVNSCECSVFSDRFGSYPIYYAKLGTGLLFSTQLKTLLRYLPQQEINPQALYHYCYFHMIPSPMTLYKGIYRLQPAEHLCWKPDQRLETALYWLPEFSENAAAPDQMETELRETLAQSVARHGAQPGGAFLSGGLDSSTITGLMCEQTNNRDAFSIGFPVEAYNELEYARCAVNQFGARGHEYIITPENVLEALPVIAAGMEQPFGNSSALPTYFCAKFAKENGVSRLLAGDGGDELFAGNERYAKQHLFEHYAALPQSLRTISDAFWSADLWHRIPGLAKASSYVRQARVPLPDRLQTYNFLHKIELAEIFDPNFLAQVATDAPLTEQRAVFTRPQDASTLNRMLYLDWKYTLADNDLVKVSSMCRLAGVDVRYPMLDNAVVDLSCRVPSQAKLTPRRLRYFYKQAFGTFLPRKIIDKPKQGFGLPFGVWLQQSSQLQSTARSGLEQLGQLELFNPAFLERAMKLNQQEHAAYYGELVWVMMMLGLWLKEHNTMGSNYADKS